MSSHNAETIFTLELKWKLHEFTIIPKRLSLVKIYSMLI